MAKKTDTTKKVEETVNDTFDQMNNLTDRIIEDSGKENVDGDLDKKDPSPVDGKPEDSVKENVDGDLDKKDPSPVDEKPEDSAKENVDGDLDKKDPSPVDEKPEDSVNEGGEKPEEPGNEGGDAPLVQTGNDGEKPEEPGNEGGEKPEVPASDEDEVDEDEEEVEPGSTLEKIITILKEENNYSNLACGAAIKKGNYTDKKLSEFYKSFIFEQTGNINDIKLTKLLAVHLGE